MDQKTITMVVDNAPFFAYDQYGWDEEVDLNLAEFFSTYYHDEFKMEPEFQSHLISIGNGATQSVRLKRSAWSGAV